MRLVLSAYDGYFVGVFFFIRYFTAYIIDSLFFLDLVLEHM